MGSSFIFPKRVFLRERQAKGSLVAVITGAKSSPPLEMVSPNRNGSTPKGKGSLFYQRHCVPLCFKGAQWRRFREHKRGIVEALGASRCPIAMRRWPWGGALTCRRGAKRNTTGNPNRIPKEARRGALCWTKTPHFGASFCALTWMFNLGRQVSSDYSHQLGGNKVGGHIAMIIKYWVKHPSMSDISLELVVHSNVLF